MEEIKLTEEPVIKMEEIKLTEGPVIKMEELKHVTKTNELKLTGDSRNKNVRNQN